MSKAMSSKVDNMYMEYVVFFDGYNPVEMVQRVNEVYEDVGFDEDRSVETMLREWYEYKGYNKEASIGDDEDEYLNNLFKDDVGLFGNFLDANELHLGRVGNCWYITHDFVGPSLREIEDYIKVKKELKEM